MSRETLRRMWNKTAQDGITTKEIRARVLSMLKAKNPEWERNWMVYDTAVKEEGGLMHTGENTREKER